ncbi:sigma factor-like helix-turn-helix DNA-binding protein [Staphylococcus shinii]|uniref:sigma factor-like helix-turn-helix DNA-binding protein n=1 Tax=Staphylococcus shinii TaxID=2912228 RepID=UPI00298ED2C6|nr:sigma factor-like helix-turn-helix DNA-binding protein [Staphylococcus shinii]MDW8563618.1 sigma factor-like helix-turn-helix DNA-binding protein [Staphylococcus shinii]
MNAPQVLVLKDIINGLRDELKLNYQGIADIPFSNPQLQVKEAIINSLPYKDVEFYFRNGFKLKKTIDITCNEAKESDIKKIKELEINKIENLIKIIPSNIKNLKGMNEKSTSRVLKLLLNKLVITYNNDIVLEGISYNFFRNHHYNFWLNIEDNILYSLTCKVDDVIKKYVNVNYHSFKELSYFISHNTEIIKEIEGLELSKQEANELVYSYLKNYSTKMNYKYLKEKFEKVNNKINFVEIVNNLIDEGLVTLEDGKIVTLKKPVLYYAKRLKSENQFEALKYRLKNYTLQEIEDKLGLTRERARQLIKQGLNNLPSNVRERIRMLIGLKITN